MQAPWVSNFDRKDVVVELKPEQLAEFGVSSAEVRSALLKREFDQSLGSIRYEETGDKQVTVSQKYKNVAEIGNTLVRSGVGSRVYLRDVADVKLEIEEAERLFKSNGQKGLIVGASTKPDANISKACYEFLEKAKTLVHSIDPDLKVTVLLNPGSYIRNAVRNIFFSVLLGILVSTIVLFLFFGALRHTLVIGLSIPLSLMGGFILMQVLGIEMNLVSLGAMALAAGMVVDGGVVVFENCIRLYEIHKPKSYSEALELVIKGMVEVRAPVIASVLTTSIVFAPLPFTSPIAAAILGDMAKVMVCVLVMSLFVALVILPALILYLSADPMRMIPQPEKNPLSARFQGLVSAVQRAYERSLRLLLQSKVWSRSFLGGTAAVFLASLLVMGLALDSEIMPLPDSDQIFLSLRYKRQKFDLKTSEKIVDAQEARVHAEFGHMLDKTLSQVRDRGGWILTFLKNSNDADELKEKLELSFKNTPIMRFHTFPWVPSSLKIPDPPAVQMTVSASGRSAKLAKLEQLDEAVSDIEEHGRIEVEPAPRYSDTFDVTMKRNNLGLVSREFASHFDEKRLSGVVRSALSESNVMDIELGGKSSSVMMRYPKNFIQSPQDIENLQLAFNGQYYALRHFADVRPRRVHREIVTENGNKVARLSVWPKQAYEGSRKDFQKLVYKEVADVFGGKFIGGAEQPIVPGITFDDADKEIRENTTSLLVALGLALLLVLILVCFQFGSLRKTLVVMLAVPLGTIGVSFSLYLVGVPLSVNSLLGLILLAGTSVNNSIVFVDFYDHLRKTKPAMRIEDALLETARVRFRPIAITTLTTILGMLPIAIGLGEGGEIMRPLGIAVCGGLFISTALTILMVPVALRFIEQVSARFTPIKAASSSAVLAVVLAAFSLGSAELLPLQAKGAQPNPVQSLSLAIVDQLVRQKNSQFLNADLDARIAKDRKYAAVGDFLPQVSLDLRRDIQSASGSEFSSSSARGLRVKQSLSGPLHQAWRVSELSARQRSAELQKIQSQSDALLDARLQLFALVRAQKLSEVAQRLLETSQNYASVAKKRYNAGLIDLSAELRSRNQLLAAEVEAINAAREIELQRSRLAELLQTPIHSAASITQAWPQKLALEAIPGPQWQQILVAVNSGQQIPLEIARQELKVQSTGRNRSLRGLLPEVIAEYSYQKRAGDTKTALPEQEVQVGLQWDLFRGGKNFFETRAAVLQARKANNTLSQAQTSFPLMVQVLDARLKQSLGLKRVSTERAASQRRILAQSQKKFDRGLIDALDLSQDIQSWVQTEKAMINSTMDALRAIVDLCKLAGDEALFYKLT
jgi:multidrug efflux pump subunit AcrB/outer membrane protein TolC